VTEVKLCGMTRPADIEYAVELGVRYVGCIFAGGPRQRTMAEAATLFRNLGGPTPGRVGVFARVEPSALEAAASALTLEAVQLHDDPSAELVAALRRRRIGAEIWAVLRCPRGERLLPLAAELWRTADALVLDAQVTGQLGGTGTPLAWSELAEGVAALRALGGRGRLVLAGGLTPENVGEAIAALRPDVVDVSSGIESAPGRKHPARMRAFVEAVATADRGALEPPPSPSSSHPHSSRTR
jgi:phosphoribosylanthranilate isomerase